MKITLKVRTCTVTREKNDPKFYGTLNGAGESRLLYHVKQKLITMGYKVIKKRMYKDGHMVDEMQQYIRTVNGHEPSFMIWNSNWNIKGAEEDFNQGEVVLSVERNIWNKD